MILKNNIIEAGFYEYYFNLTNEKSKQIIFRWRPFLIKKEYCMKISLVLEVF